MNVKRILRFRMIFLSLLLIGLTVFGTINQMEPKIQVLNVVSPAGVVGQPYIVRVFVTPLPTDSSKLKIGLEGHIELFGVNFSVGTFTEYPNFSLDGEAYIGVGLRLGGLYLAMNATATNLSSIFNISSLENPQVSFGLIGFRRTRILTTTWSRFELSYIPIGLVYKDGDQLKISDNFDWRNATARLIIESIDNGYFLFAFYTGLLSELENGNFKYAFELALPSAPLYVYLAQDFEGKWKAGLGAALLNLNALGIYEISTGNISWVVNGQF
ncbi:MAG: hypothetical protein ACK4MM_04085 [Fervidobacterium sp.]